MGDLQISAYYYRHNTTATLANLYSAYEGMHQSDMNPRACDICVWNMEGVSGLQQVFKYTAYTMLVVWWWDT